MESVLSRLLDALPGMVWTAKADGTTDFVNQHWTDYTGQTLEEASASGWATLFHPDDLAGALAAWESTHEDNPPDEINIEARLRRADGIYRRFKIQTRPLRDAAGALQGWCGINTDMEEQARAETQLAAEKRLLKLAARGMELPNLLHELCVQFEGLFPGAYCSIIFVDDDGHRFRVGAGASLPAAYNAVLDGLKIDPAYGPCSLAIETRQTVIVTNPQGDPRWRPDEWPAAMAEFGLVSCWSAPILSSRGDALGIFAIYRRDPVGPTAEERELIDRFTKIAGIGFERAQSDAALKASETDLRRANHFLAGGQRLSKTGSFSLDTVSDAQVWSEENYRLWEFDPAVPPTMEMVTAAIHPDDREDTLNAFAEATRAARDFEVFYRIVTPVAGVKHVHTVMEIIPEFTDRTVYLGSTQDVTERHLAEAALKASEADLRRANRYLAGGQRLSKTGSFTWDVATDAQDWSEELYRIWEMDPSDDRAVPTLHASVLHPDDVPGVEAIMEPALEAGADYEVSYRIVTRSGAIKHLHTVNERVAEITDRLVYVGATRDLTQSRLAEEALKANEAELRRANRYLAGAQTLSRIGSFTWDVSADDQDWSDENYRIWEFDPSAPPTMEMVLAVIHPDDLAMVTQAVSGGAQTGGDMEVFFRIVTPGGGVKHLHTVATRVREITDRLVYIGSTQDVTENKLAEADLARANTYLLAAQNLSQTGSFTWDVAADEHNWSEVIYRVFGFARGVKVTMAMMMNAIHPEDIPQVEGLIGGAQIGENFEMAFRIVTPAGDVRHAHVMGHRIDQIPDRPVFMGALQDITARKLAENDLNHARAQLAHMSRVTALSALTASIAHEVSQPLAGIITNANTCLRTLATDPPDLDVARATAQRTLRDGNRASEVIKRLRALFSRKPPSLERLDLEDAVREVLALSASELQRRRVTLRNDFAGGLPSAYADRVQLQQVILNLVLNAADAMAGLEGRARDLMVSTHLDPDGMVTLDVSDTGPGIDPQQTEHLFRPFHTTKPDGMGIGLSISRSIIEAHGGRISGASNPRGPGATFSFSIPSDTVSVPEPVMRQA